MMKKQTPFGTPLINMNIFCTIIFSKHHIYKKKVWLFLIFGNDSHRTVMI